MCYRKLFQRPEKLQNNRKVHNNRNKVTSNNQNKPLKCHGQLISIWFPDSEFHANQVIFCNFSPLYWIGHFESFIGLTSNLKAAARKTPRYWVSCKSDWILQSWFAILNPLSWVLENFQLWLHIRITGVLSK